MSVWDNGDGGYGNQSRFRTIPMREFGRRFRRCVTHNERSYVWFLGAGASESSGVPTAATLVRIWLRELKYVETGQDGDLDAWAAKRFVGYDPDDPATVYGAVLEALFHTDEDRRHEIKRLIAGAEPGFGYATLAQLMTHKQFGDRTSLVVTTNFDDLFAEALHLFSQRPPRILANGSVDHIAQLGEDTPTLVRVYGDAHMPREQRERGNRPQLDKVVRERLSERIADAGLVFVGYGGRDDCVLDLLENLPSKTPTGGIFWVSERPPSGAFGDELARREAVWVPHNDFDELMYFVRAEFGLPHPQIDRFERLLLKYNAQYNDLSTRNGIDFKGEGGASAAIDDDGKPRALPAGSSADGIDTRAFRGGIGRRKTAASQEASMRASVRAFRRAVEEAGSRAEGRRGIDRDGAQDLDGAEDRGEERRRRLGEADDRNAVALDYDGRDAPIEPSAAGADDAGQSRPERVDQILDEAVQDLRRGGRDALRVLRSSDDEAGLERLDGKPVAADPSAIGRNARRARIDRDGAAPARPDDERAPAADAARIERAERRVARAGRGRGDPASVDDVVAGGGEDAAPLRSGRLDEARRGAMPPEPLHRLSEAEAAAGDAALAAALERAPEDVTLLARRARFLTIAAGDLAGAEACYERAFQSAPKNVALLREYAQFALERLDDKPRAERLLTNALYEDLRSAETLVSLSNFLLRARGDLEEAENCLRLATEVGPDDPRGAVAYADFLERRRGRRDAAEAQLRHAADVASDDATTLAELALFRIRGMALDPAEQALRQAARRAPEAPIVLFARAELSREKGDFETAEALYERAVEADPADTRIRLAFAEFLENRAGGLDEAERHYRNAVAVAPHRAGPMSAYGRFLRVVRRDADKADAFHQRAVRTEPNDPFVLSAYAEHVASTPEMREQADAFFRDALELAPGAVAIRRAYGRFLAEELKDADGAEAQFRRAVEIDPTSAGALDELAQFLHEIRSDAEEAEVYFREALKFAPDRAETLHRFAGFLRETRRDVEEAERFYRRALEKNPKDAETLGRAAQFLLAQGRRKEGVKVLNEAFDAAWRMPAAQRPDALMLELFIYRYAHDEGRRDEALDEALELIDHGARCDGRDFGATVEAALRAGHPDPELLRDLVAVAADGEDPSILDEVLDEDDFAPDTPRRGGDGTRH